MKKLYLHIGLGKTGSSALQSWLSLNAEALARQGIDYADTVPEVKYGESLSGNGSQLHQACVKFDFEEVESLLKSTYFFTPKNDVAIISCELFQGVRLSTIEQLREICAANAIDIRVIAYARSAYEGLYSTYMQFIKRSDCTHSFGERESDTSIAMSVEYLRRYLEVFGDRMTVLNYDEARKDIYGSFAAVTGIDTSPLKTFTKKVNRSLSPREGEVLRRINALHGGAFSTRISNYLIAQAPDKKTAVYYTQALVARVRENTAADVGWINEQFRLSPPLATDNYRGEDSEAPGTPTLESYQPVLEWALACEPESARAAELVAFLKEFAAFLIEMSDKEPLALLKRAATLKKERVFEDISEDESSEPGPPRQRYLLSYVNDYKLPSSEDDAGFGARFKDWAALVGEFSVGADINPLEKAHLLKAGESGLSGIRPMASGFTIIEVDDEKIAMSLARACPLIDIGGTVEVSSIVQLY